METLYKIIAYFLSIPKDTARELQRNPADPFYRSAPKLALVESDVIPETVRRGAGQSKTPTEGSYVIDRPPRNTSHRG